MRQPKFTMNALLIVVTLMSALVFFVLIFMTGLADHSAVNEFYRIDGTEYAVRYSNKKGNGLYEGEYETTAKLVVPGDFGHDWGLVMLDGCLYTNEYSYSDLGLMFSDIVRIDLETYTKDTVMKNAVLRGRCASGELVCTAGTMVPSNFPKTNPLCRLYAMTDPEFRADGTGGMVFLIDPDTGSIVYSVRDDEVLSEGFEARYLDKTLEEIRG